MKFITLGLSQSWDDSYRGTYLPSPRVLIWTTCMAVALALAIVSPFAGIWWAFAGVITLLYVDLLGEPYQWIAYSVGPLTWLVVLTTLFRLVVYFQTREEKNEPTIFDRPL